MAADVTGAATAVRIEAAPRLAEPAVTMQWCRERVEVTGKLFTAFRANCAEADSFYLNNYDMGGLHRDGTVIKLGQGTSVINTLIAHVMPQYLDISVPPPGPRGRIRAEKLEAFLFGAHQMMEQRSPANREIVKHAALYGVAWEKVEFIGDQWGGFPDVPDEGEDEDSFRERIAEISEKRAGLWPIESRVINPQNVIWDTYNGFRPRWVVTSSIVDAGWLSAHFAAVPGADSDGDSDGRDWENPSDRGEVTLYEAWTHDQVAYFTDDFQWVMKPRKHGYRRLPWVQYWPQTGLLSAKAKPDEVYRGILHPAFDIIRGSSKLASHYVDIVAKTAWPNRAFTGPQAMAEATQAAWSDRPGAMNVLPPNVTLVEVPVPTPPNEIMAAKDMLDSATEELTVSKVARGQSPSGVASGFHTAVLAGIASLNFGPVKEATERGLQEKGEIMLGIVEFIIRDRVTVFGRTEAGTVDATIGPSDIRGHTVNLIRINSVSPEEAERKLQTWANLWRIKFVDLDTALRKGGVPQPLEVQAKLLEEAIEQSEPVQQAIAGEAAKRVPFIAEAMEAAAAAATGSPQQTDDIAQQILASQGNTQLPNPGNFSSSQQPTPSMPGGLGTGHGPATPGSLQDANTIARQLSGPRSGNVDVPWGGTISPGGAIA